MPAQKKYLSKSPLERLLKISAGFVGGFMVTESMHMAIGVWTHMGNALMTLRYAGFILWASLFIVALIARRGWKIWLIYLTITMVFGALVYCGINT